MVEQKTFNMSKLDHL